MVFDATKLFYMMPVAQNSVKMGDFILHNGAWVKVISILSAGRIEAEDIWKHEVVTMLPTTNIFGFNFYTKLVPLMENFGSNCAATASNPFGMLPMLMAMNDSKDNDMSEMLLMSMMMNGGQPMGNINPMMLMLMCNSDSKNKKMDGLLPMLMAFSAMSNAVPNATVACQPMANMVSPEAEND